MEPATACQPSHCSLPNVTARDLHQCSFSMDSRERPNVDGSIGVREGDAMGPAMFCTPLLPVLKLTREELGPKRVESLAYLDDISIGMPDVTTNTVAVVYFCQREWRLCTSASERRHKLVPSTRTNWSLRLRRGT